MLKALGSNPIPHTQKSICIQKVHGYKGKKAQNLRDSADMVYRGPTPVNPRRRLSCDSLVFTGMFTFRF
jgi:hypothetical protein